MVELFPNERIKNRLGKNTSSAKAYLTESIEEDGVRDRIVIWFNPETNRTEIVDGLHRYELAIARGLEFETFEKHFDSEDDAVEWAMKNQVARRNQNAQVNLDCIVELMEIAQRRNPNISDKELKEEITSEAKVSERTYYNAKVKMGFEIKPQGDYDEFDQSAPEEFAQEGFNEFNQESPDKFDQRERPFGGGKRKKKPLSIEAQQRKAIKTGQAAVNGFEVAYKECCAAIKNAALLFGDTVLDPPKAAEFDYFRKYLDELEKKIVVKKKFGR